MVDRNRTYQVLSVLAGIALVITGLNGSTPLVIVGGVLIFLGLLGRLTEGRSHA